MARKTREKFDEEREGRIQPVVAKNDNQKVYIHSLQFNSITAGKGSAGTGKTFLAAKIAANKYLKGEIERIVVMRPLVGMGNGSGFWPGTIQDKLGPWLAPILNVIKKTIGDNRYECDFGKTIQIQPMESVRGMSFDQKTFVIVDEAQNCTPEEIRSLTTRLEEGSQVAFCGDDFQKDLKGVSGIKYLADLIKTHNIPNCAVVEFTPKDIVRSGLTKILVEIFEKEGPAPK